MKSGLRLISAAKPEMMEYQLAPWLHYDEESWILPEDDSLVPDTIDFTITGMIAALGCPGVTEPPAVALFAGSGHHHESENINKLLQYKTPDKNRFHVDKGTKEIEFHIYNCYLQFVGSFCNHPIKIIDYSPPILDRLLLINKNHLIVKDNNENDKTSDYLNLVFNTLIFSTEFCCRNKI